MWKTQSCLIVRLELKEKSGDIDWGLGFGVVEKVLCSKHWLAWLWVQKPKLPAVAMDAQCFRHLTWALREETKWKTETGKNIQFWRHWSRIGSYLGPQKQWLKHCPVIASLNPAASPLHITEHWNGRWTGMLSPYINGLVWPWPMTCSKTVIIASFFSIQQCFSLCQNDIQEWFLS